MEGKFQEKALLYLRKNLFSKHFQVKECSGYGCENRSLSKKELEKWDNCIYEGHLRSDPDSKVILDQCDENGAKDISIISEKVYMNLILYWHERTAFQSVVVRATDWQYR